MATGGEVGGTREQSSDGAEDYHCSVCSEDGHTTEASHYCPDCDTCYCKTCLCDHNVIGKTNIAQWGKGTKTAVKEEDQSENEEVTCLRHPQYKVELYCMDHDVLCCQMCPSKDHRSCKQMKRIAVAAEHIDLSETLQSIRADISTLRKNAEYLSKDSTLKKRCTESSHIQYVNQIRAMQEKVNAQFEKTIDESEGYRKHYVDKFNTDQLMCKDLISKLHEMTTALEPMEDKTKHFVNVKRTKELVEGHNKEMESVLNTPVTGVFKDVPVAEEKSTLNAVVDTIAINMVDMKFTVYTRDDDRESNIVGICQIENGNLVLADKANKCLKQLDGNYTVINRHLLKDSPEGVCALDDSEIAVTTENDRILIVAVGNKFEIRRSIDLSVSPSHVSYHDKFVYITDKSTCPYMYNITRCRKHIYKYDKLGNQIASLQSGSYGGNYHEQNVHSPLAVSPDGDKIYVRGCHHIFSVCTEGSQIIESSEFSGFGGICVDKSSYIYISKNSQVLKLSQTNKEQFKKESSVDLEETVGALCYDNHLNRVAVCQQNGNYIYIRMI